MSGMVASALERRINEALNDLTDEEIQRLDRIVTYQNPGAPKIQHYKT